MYSGSPGFGGALPEGIVFFFLGSYSIL
jgi:hypothetical protein